MRALFCDGDGFALRTDHPEPTRPEGWATLGVVRAGICRTDLELTRGYMGFAGVLGHEFMGRVERADDAGLVGRRVVGEINAACGTCSWCLSGLGRHCPHRSVLGILRHDGCMAERCALPVANLHLVPDPIPDDRAVFTEPLSAAYEILDQVEVGPDDRVVVLGDGKLGILCAWVLSTASGDVTLVGRHAAKLARAGWGGVRTVLEAPPPRSGPPPVGWARGPGGGRQAGHRDRSAGDTGDDPVAPAGAVDTTAVAPGADIVVDATGSAAGIVRAMELCRPRGTLVLKSTVALAGDVNLAPVVVNEITVVGSRCGRFERGLDGLVRHGFPVERLIDDRYPLERAEEAFAHAARRGTLKILIDVA